MMAHSELITAIDVGTTKVCTIVGRQISAKHIEVLAHNTVPCDGLRKGNVWDVAVTEEGVRASIAEAEQAIGEPIESAFVGVTGSHVGFENRKDKLDSVGKIGVITADDLLNLPETLDSSFASPGRKVIHAIRTSYSLDGEDGIRHPMGMHSDEVEAETHLVTGGATFIGKLVQAVENAGLSVESLVLEPLASGLAVLTAGEKERGAMLVDIGGGTSDLVGFKHGRISYSAVVPVGGYQFTNDIALTFNAPYEAAENAKLVYASAEVHPVEAGQDISLPVIGRDVELKLKRQEICQLTRERAQELARLIKLQVDEAELGDPSDVRLVLTGGASNLPGLAPLMQRTVGIPVRLGSPNGAGWVPDELKQPLYATGVGILLWAATEYVPEPHRVNGATNGATQAGSKGFMADLLGRLSRMMAITPFAAKKGRT